MWADGQATCGPELGTYPILEWPELQSAPFHPILQQWLLRAKGVRRDEDIGIAADRQFQKLIVLRITAGGDPLGDLTSSAAAISSCSKSEKIWRDQWRQARGRRKETNNSRSVIVDLRRRWLVKQRLRLGAGFMDELVDITTLWS